VIADPPLEAGATKVTVAWALPPTAVAPVGASGMIGAGVTLFEESETLLPVALVAVTVKVYAVPLVRPVTTWISPVVPALLSTPPAGDELTVYPVIADPPFVAGATKVTVALALLPTAVTLVTIPGTFPFTFTVAVTALGAFGVVPRYCAVIVREPVVVGIQVSVAYEPFAGRVTVPSTVLPSRN